MVSIHSKIAAAPHVAPKQKTTCGAHGGRLAEAHVEKGNKKGGSTVH